MIVFFGLALLPVLLAGVAGPWPGRSLPELRPPRPFPTAFAPDTFAKAGAWLADRIGPRLPLLWLGAEMSASIWRPRIVGKVIVGRETPWLFWADDDKVPDRLMDDVGGRIRMKPAEIATLDRTMRTIRDGATACGKTALFLIAPNKQSIYPEKLFGTGAVYGRSRFDDFLDRLSPASRAATVDVRPALRAEKHAHRWPLYIPTDTHWSHLGAFVAYRETIRALAARGAVADPERASLDRFTLEARHFAGGDMVMRILLTPWRYDDELVLLSAKDDALVFPPAAGETQIIQNPLARGRLLVHGDSFSPPLAKLLARHFAETHLVLSPFNRYPPVEDRIRNGAFDVVIFQIVERNLPHMVDPLHSVGRFCSG